ncbi:MAG: DNA polymerase III subunit chi [Alcanivoracaceae bacterium]
MTEVWFYVANGSDANNRGQLLRRLLERALRSPRQLYLHVQDSQQAAQLDDWLWQPAHSFLPHGPARPDGPGEQVVIGHGPDPGPCHDILVNLADDIPDFFSRFQRVAELVAGSDNEKSMARDRWRFYRDRGYPVTKHELDGS